MSEVANESAHAPESTAGESNAGESTADESNAGDPHAGRRRSRLIEWVDPKVIRESIATGGYRTGLEMLRGMAAGEIPRPPMSVTLGFRPTSFEEGQAVFEYEPDESGYNPLGMVHGGVAATLLDTAMGCAVHTLLPIQTGYSTLELKINYLRPMHAGMGRVRAIGKILHLGKSTALAEGRLVDADDRLLAHGSTTCLILAPRGSAGDRRSRDRSSAEG